MHRRNEGSRLLLRRRKRYLTPTTATPDGDGWLTHVVNGSGDDPASLFQTEHVVNGSADDPVSLFQTAGIVNDGRVPGDGVAGR